MLQQHFSIDEQTIAQAELNAYVEAQAQELAPEIEIDSVIDHDFGTLYRVWDGHCLLGTYYYALDGKWVAQSSYDSKRPRCNTQSEAELLVIAMSGRLVADTAPELREVEELLDKPFDELTLWEWEYLKQHAQPEEFLAA
ncbi:MAG: hypothetical protein PUP91_25265 [Rhizonema sp. PD37]|nr:hypothetical protein [Rhizonema sp. PD37]